MKNTRYGLSISCSGNGRFDMPRIRNAGPVLVRRRNSRPGRTGSIIDVKLPTIVSCRIR